MNTSAHSSTKGFTVIELIFIIVLVAAASVIFFLQKNNLETAARDDTRKVAINAMYYSLEEVYFKENGHYPRTINSTTLPSVDPELFKDPYGVELGKSDSNYRYEPVDCTGDACARYTLRSVLENEDDFIKTNRDDN